MKADIIAFESQTLVSKMLRKVTGSRITHLAIRINRNTIMETSLFGVRERKLGSKEYPYDVLRCDSLSEKARNDIVEYVSKNFKIGSDFKLILCLGINILLKKNDTITMGDKFICLHMILNAYKHIGVNLLPKMDINLMIPDDIYKAKLLRVCRKI